MCVCECVCVNVCVCVYVCVCVRRTCDTLGTRGQQTLPSVNLLVCLSVQEGHIKEGEAREGSGGYEDEVLVGAGGCDD
jgi:hypothetical protein